jgi:PEP-CTERM motif
MQYENTYNKKRRAPMKKTVKSLIMSAAAVLMFVGGAQAVTLNTFVNNYGGWAAAIPTTDINWVRFNAPLPGPFPGGHSGSLASQTQVVDLNANPLTRPLMVNASVNSTVGTSTYPGFYDQSVPPVLVTGWGDMAVAGSSTTFSFAGTAWGTKAISADWILSSPYILGDQTGGGGLKFTLFFADGTSIIDPLNYNELAYGTGYNNIGWTSDAYITGLQIDSYTGVAQNFSATNFVYDQVPEPSTFVLFGAGLAGLMIRLRKGRKTA